MIPPNLVDEVRRLLAERALSQRRIAVLTGVSRASVGQIARGRRPDYQPRPPRDIDLDEPLGPFERCPGCGGRVFLPCRLCRVRAIQAKALDRARFRRQWLAAGRGESTPAACLPHIAPRAALGPDAPRPAPGTRPGAALKSDSFHGIPSAR